LKVVVGTDDERAVFLLPQCSAGDAIRRQTSLLANIVERAQSYECRIFGSGGGKQIRNELAELNEVLMARERKIEDLEAQLESANNQLKVYIRDAMPARTVHHHRKIPPGHSKASVTKKRRLVQKVEYED